MDVLEKNKLIRYSPIPETNRVNAVFLNQEKIKLFFDMTKDISDRDLEYIPYYRFIVADILNHCFQNELRPLLLDILQSYKLGAFLIDCNALGISEQDYLKAVTAISHLIGYPNIDLLSGKYYATFTVIHDLDPKINLLRPYTRFKMHTDGAFMTEPTDWVLLMKIQEQSANGGETTLLHLAEWNEFDNFYHHKFGGQYKFLFKGPDSTDIRAQTWGNHRATDSCKASILTYDNQCRSIRFVDQFIHPQSILEARYISELQNSLEKSKHIATLSLSVGSILIINNRHWVHGRNTFIKNTQLSRKLMRQRGSYRHEY